MIKPYSVSRGGTFGIFAPSTPAHVSFQERFYNGISNIKKMGYDVVVGKLTSQFIDQGYRTASGAQRADELNQLFNNNKVDIIVSTIGGANSSSLLEYLDYDAIAKSRKIFCGYSDVTSIHMAINTLSDLSTLYGPAVIPSFGEMPSPIEETVAHFQAQVESRCIGEVMIPDRWSNKGLSWVVDEEEGNKGGRIWNKNTGLQCLCPGTSSGKSVVAHLNTLVCIAGTKFFPRLKGKILFLDEMSCSLSRLERNLTQLKLIGAFDDVSGIVLSKPEKYDQQNAPFDYMDLLLEIINRTDIPIIANFDCGHTHPMISIPQGIDFQIVASNNGCSIRQMESFCA